MPLNLTLKKLKKEYDKTEDDLKALQSVGQIIGEVLRQLDEGRCTCNFEKQELANSFLAYRVPLQTLLRLPAVPVTSWGCGPG